MDENRKTSKEHWENTWTGGVPWRHRTNLNVTIADHRSLMAREVKAGMRYLEIGCAPGYNLSYIATKLKAEVSGLDYAPVGLQQARQLFDSLGVRADIRCEDVFATTFPEQYFDVVFSGGVIEHFEDPRELVRIHVELLKPGGTALITVPNFGGIYGTLAARTDPANLAIHNVGIMNVKSLLALAPADLSASVTAWPIGRMSLSAVSFQGRVLRPFGWGAKAVANLMGMAQIFEIPLLCPSLMLRITRNRN